MTNHYRLKQLVSPTACSNKTPSFGCRWVAFPTTQDSIGFHGVISHRGYLIPSGNPISNVAKKSYGSHGHCRWFNQKKRCCFSIAMLYNIILVSWQTLPSSSRVAGTPSWFSWFCSSSIPMYCVDDALVHTIHFSYISLWLVLVIVAYSH